MDTQNFKINGYWDGEPIWRPLTPREKLQSVIKASKVTETVSKGMNFIADCFEVKVKNLTK